MAKNKNIKTCKDCGFFIMCDKCSKKQDEMDIKLREKDGRRTN